MLSARILGVGLLGPGLESWTAGAASLAGTAPYQPARTMLPPPAVLPPAERRRAGRLVRLALAAGAQAVTHAAADARALASVFSSSGGDGDNCHEICQTLTGAERQISPTRFHNSVHNAPAGYWSIAHGCMQPFTALCAYDGSFGAGLLESLSQLSTGADHILLISYDLDYPEPMRACRPIPDALAIALLLARPERAVAGTLLSVDFTGAAASELPEPSLEILRRQIPAGRGLPLLRGLALGGTDRVVLDYLGDTRLSVQLQP